ncbi:FUSC family protein [Saccharopolyspora hirsuta]|uniref:FUSC family protein n=1 Tax=Saccharopolyspora hirsuta TaxID=1837 RepID=A0A5M7CA65_SACHI|nr:FUSC family protein [Saccharopolyspora hirsuta]KAA5838290.1 FUSC family protein [Saccharopolyspora hirsuta]
MNVLDRAEPDSALTRLRRTLRVRDALRYTRTIGGVAVPALRIGVSFGVPIAALAAAGRTDLVPFAAFGAFTSLYCRVDTWSRRARLLPLIALGLVASVATATMIAATTDDALIGVLVLSAIATVGKLAADVLEFGPPGGLMFVFAAGAAAYATQDWSAAGLHIGVTAASAALSAALSLLGNLLHPTGPHRVAAARALVAVADHLDNPNPATRHRAHLAVHRASATLRGTGRTVTALRAHLADAEHLLHHPADAVHLRDLARKLHRGRIPQPSSAPQFQLKPRSAPGDGSQFQLKPRSARISPFLPNAGRMLLSCLIAGLVTIAVGLDHAYWAVVSASAVLQSTNATATWLRTVQRLLGTLAGAVVAFAMFGLHPSPVVILVLVVVCQLVAELFVQANYALGLLFVTPLALGLASLSNPGAHNELIAERITTTVLGALIAAAVSLVLINRQSARRLNAALAECREALQQLRGAEESTVARARLTRAVFALRNAHAVADGEPWHRNPRTREVLDTEHEAYELLAATAPSRTTA